MTREPLHFPRALNGAGILACLMTTLVWIDGGDFIWLGYTIGGLMILVSYGLLIAEVAREGS